MKKYILSVIGEDKPGIVSFVAKTLAALDCNIENVSQTILQGNFAGIFTASCPTNLTKEMLDTAFAAEIGQKPLMIDVEPMKDFTATTMAQTQPFIVTTNGPDGKGLVAGITEILAAHGVNITSLQAIFKGGTNANHNGMIYGVDVPLDTDLQELRQALHQRAQELNLNLSMQHADIFRAVNRI